MINKRSIWFLTLFSLILVLSIYYITMPTELLLGTNNNYIKESPTTKVEESTILVALRVEADDELLREMEVLQQILTSDSSIEDKNLAFDKMKLLNSNRGEEEKLEVKVKEKFQLESFVKIKDDQIEVVINKSEGNTDLANKIMRSLQEDYDIQKYITVKFTT